MNRPGSWKIWVIVGFSILIAFNWLNEILDLPHNLLAAPPTPINWKESIIETVFALIMGITCWVLIQKFELRWLETTKKLEIMAAQDELSQLLNRREFLKRAQEEFERARRFGHPLSIAIIDLDHFKRINDEYGHLAGDQVIRKFADEVNLSIRKLDLAGRLGGDEFMIAFVETTGVDAQRICERIQRTWYSLELTSETSSPIKSTLSAGLTEITQNDHSILDCIKRADKALYSAKRRGRNRIISV